MEIKWAFPPGLVAGQELARQFGRKVAEKPIQDDMREDPGLGSPHGDLFVDTSGNIEVDDNMITWMGLRGNLSWAQVERMKDWRHRRKEFATPPPEDWKRPDAVCHTRVAKEYYEIKPMSPSGIDNAEEKFRVIDEFIAGPLAPRPPWEKPLPYVRGEKYMTENEIREKEIEIPALLQPMLKILLDMFKLTEIRIFVVWNRPMPAMILYLFKIVVKTKDNRPAKSGAMQSLAEYVLKLAIQAETGAALVKPPAGVITVEVPPELDEFKEAIKASAGGMVFDGVPGETHLLVIEEPGFQRIIERQRQLPPFLRSAGPMFNHEEWQKAIRDFDAEQARRRNQMIVIGGVFLFACVAIYVCWPVIAAAGAAEVAASGGAIAGEVSIPGVVTGGSGVAGRAGPIVVENFLKGLAANDNAVGMAKQAAAGVIGLVATGFVFGNVKDAEAAERVLKTGIMTKSDAAFDPTWLLRPSKFFASPSQFGDMVDVSAFGIIRIPGIVGPIDEKFAPKMRFIAKVTFS